MLLAFIKGVIKRAEKHFLKILYELCIQNRDPPIINMHCFVALSGLIYSNKNTVSIWLRTFPSTHLSGHQASEIFALLEATGKEPFCGLAYKQWHHMASKYFVIF